MTNERKQQLLDHARASLDKWNKLDARYKSPSSAPYSNVVGCEEMIAILEELEAANNRIAEAQAWLNDDHTPETALEALRIAREKLAG